MEESLSENRRQWYKTSCPRTKFKVMLHSGFAVVYVEAMESVGAFDVSQSPSSSIDPVRQTTVADKDLSRTSNVTTTEVAAKQSKLVDVLVAPVDTVA